MLLTVVSDDSARGSHVRIMLSVKIYLALIIGELICYSPISVYIKCFCCFICNFDRNVCTSFFGLLQHNLVFGYFGYVLVV